MTPGARVAVALAAAALLASACGGDDGDVTAFCERARDQERFDVMFDGFDIADRERAHEQLAAAQAELDALHDLAPGELRDDLDVLRDALLAIDDAVDEIDPSDPASAREALAPIDDQRAAIDAANAELETFRQTTCQRPAGAE